MPHAMTSGAPPPAATSPLAGQGPRVVAIAALLASAGVPLYIHLPRFAAELGLSLSTVAALLLALRALDFLQDPALGLLVDRYPRQRRALATLALVGIGAGFVAVFTLQPALPGLVAALVLVFTAYSLGTILFYGQGAALAGPGGGPAHYRLAGLREAGTLAGIVAAAVLPEVLARGWGPLGGYAGFGLVLGAAALIVALVCRRFWVPVVTERQSLPLRPFLAAGGGRLLLIGLLNTMPVAITSTLFLFFVEDRLALPGLAGLYLVLFFAAAGLSAPLWSRLAARFGARRVLLPAMGLAVFAFLGTALLPPGAGGRFAVICLLSGAALGADMVILPALFASRLTRANLPAGTAFGAWSFVAKLALALSAALVLPALQWAGFSPGGDNPARALAALNIAYAVLPCALKLPAIVLVALLPEEET